MLVFFIGIFLSILIEVIFINLIRDIKYILNIYLIIDIWYNLLISINRVVNGNFKRL